MLPIYFTYLAGTSGSSIDSSQKKNRIIVNSIGFVVGFTLVFVALGATVTSLGHFLVSNRVLLRKISGLIMILFGLHFTGILKLGFLNSEKRLPFQFGQLRFFTSILFGVVFGFGWTPCLGAFLGSALLMAGNSDTILQGILLLLVYSIGLGIPFILGAILFDKIKGTMKQIQKHGRLISIVSGILLIAAGILVYTDQLKYLGNG